MKRALSLAVIFVIMTFAVSAQNAWTVDPVHSNVKFSVTHLLVSEVEGNFKVYTGAIRSSTADFANSVVEFSVDANSINTENEMRDNHLKSADFFNAAQYPKMSFKTTAWKKVGPQNYTLEGDLTIRDVTKPISFAVVYGGTMQDGYGNTKAGFKATAVINRFDFGLKWNSLTEAGGAVVGKDVRITLNLQFVQKEVL